MKFCFFAGEAEAKDDKISRGLSVCVLRLTVKSKREQDRERTADTTRTGNLQTVTTRHRASECLPGVDAALYGGESDANR